MVLLISHAALGFLPMADIAPRPISPIPIAGQNAQTPKANAIASSLIYLKLKSKVEFFSKFLDQGFKNIFHLIPSGQKFYFARF
jgi:hypothetical protein